MGTWTVASQQPQVMVWVGELSRLDWSGASPLPRAVLRQPYFGEPPRVGYVLVPARFKNEPGAESTPSDPTLRVVEGEGHLTATLFTTHPSFISFRFQFKAATNCRSWVARF